MKRVFLLIITILALSAHLLADSFAENEDAGFNPDALPVIDIVIGNGLDQTDDDGFDFDALPVVSPSQLMCEEFDSNGNPTVFGTRILRSDILHIEFTDDIDSAPGDAWDVSVNWNGSVLAWERNGTLNIAGRLGVQAPVDAYQLFACYPNLKSIAFNGCFFTTGTTNMSGMFYECESLQYLDVSGFDTSTVEDMSYMFAGCQALESLSLNGFNTTNVTDMSHMFDHCNQLKVIDAGPGFVIPFGDSAKEDMFRSCPVVIQ